MSFNIFNLRKNEKESGYKKEFPDTTVDTYLILHYEGKFVIGIDNEYDIDWESTGEFEKEIIKNEYRDKIDHILNEIALKEIRISKKWPKDVLIQSKRIIGESLARVFSFQYESALKVLKQADQFIADKSIEVARYWTLISSFKTVVTIIAIGLVCLFFKPLFLQYFSENVYRGLINGCCGSLGAFLFVLLNLGKLNVNSTSDKTLHTASGISRILIGLFSGFFIGIVIKSGLFLSIFKDNYLAIHALAFMAGISETLVPSIISKIESKNIKESTKKIKNSNSTINTTTNLSVQKIPIETTNEEQGE
ncbi:hypothetical protein AAEX28_02340 [Lentisphaerota bacterium WC36G]|nr:hypothetical protein LJT99_05225 [Lentisphaerae bacterium WC36]